MERWKMKGGKEEFRKISRGVQGHREKGQRKGD
jgi:hypothetical protein